MSLSKSANLANYLLLQVAPIPGRSAVIHSNGHRHSQSSKQPVDNHLMLQQVALGASAAIPSMISMRPSKAIR